MQSILASTRAPPKTDSNRNFFLDTSGEDPYLSAQYAIHYIKGMQEGEDARYTKTVATLKHFAAYSLEKWHEYNRIGFDAIISDEDLVQTYLPAFEAGIREGRAESVMCSYNSVNGVPSCANAFLLQDILRDQWDWKGYVVSDCGAIGFVYRPHRYKLSPEEAVAASLLAGTDLNCGNYYQHLPEAIQKGLIADSNLDRALERLFTARIKLGLFDAWKQQPYMQYPPETIGHPEHVETALQIARESLVLLKNDDGALPLSTDTNLTVAILGPHFSSTGALCGNYHGALPPIVSPLQAIKTAFASGDVAGLKGCEIHSNNTAGFDAAIKIAGEADLAILFMGIDTSIEQEGKDRETIDLPGVQAEFIEAIAKVQSKTILVLINGGPIDVSEAKTNPDIVAILEAFYPGMKGSEAIADVLFGKYNPSGRLPYTMHKKDFVDQISMADMSMTNYPGRSYRYFRGEVVYPFGYGLSYTTFEYEVQELGARFGMSGHSDVRCRVRVTNTGSVSGDTSVLAFLSFNNSTNNRHYACPQLQLVGFKKVCLLPGESKDIFFATTTAALKCYRSSDKTLSSPHGSYSVRIDNKEHRFLHGNTSVQSVH